MNRIMVIVVSVLVLSTLGWAEEAKPTPPTDLSAYLEQLQVKLDHTAQRANQPSSTASSVAGLRGSKQEPLSKQLYWKGKTGAKPISPDEVRIFRTAIEQAQAGKKDEATVNLKNFVDKYPNSGLKGDAQDTLKLLASAGSPSNPLPPAQILRLP